jgi:hypothetical protein
LCESVDKALDSDVPLFLVGDYNCDMLSNSSKYFKKILNRLNLENLRKLEYTSLILSELKTRSSQFVIFSSSASPSMSAAL